MVLIWPLKGVVPLSVLFWVVNFLLQGRSSFYTLPVLVYTLSEILFYLYQHYRCWALSRQRARPPKIPLREMLSVGMRSLSAIEVISQRAQGKREEEEGDSSCVVGEGGVGDMWSG